MSHRTHVRGMIAVMVTAAALLTPTAVLAARLWSLSSSPSGATAGDQVAVTLTVKNTGGDGGGDEMTCVTIDVPAAFDVQAISIVSVKGETSPAVHGWTSLSSGSGATRVAFKNASDKNPLVGLPKAGDTAVFRITGTPASAGTMTWTANAADHPGGATSTSCGSGTFPTRTLTLDISPQPTPHPTPTPTPHPTPTPTPHPTPTPAPTPHPSPTPTAPPTPRPTSPPTPAPTSGSTSTAAPTPADPGGPGVPTVSPGDRASPDVGSQEPDLGSPSPEVSPSPSPSTDPIAVVGGGADPGRPDDPSGGKRVIRAESVSIGGDGDGAGSGPAIKGIETAVMDIVVKLGMSAWSVPAEVLGVPGLLVVVVVLFQLLGGVAWLPVARRSLAGIGVRRRSATRSQGSGADTRI